MQENHTRTDVLFTRADYNLAEVKQAVFNMFETLGTHPVSPGSRVLIKPNFLSPAKPEHAILTHPSVVRAVVEYVLENGGHPKIMDSPATGLFNKILKDGGYLRALEGLPVEWGPFVQTMPVDIGPPFGKIDMARDAVEADLVINLPKLKTHAQMLLTLGVKNMFGCIVGLRKPRWHLRAGVDRDMFARLIAGIYRAVNPSFTIMDGIMALEGDGPGKSGRPKYLGVLAASTSAPALDKAICNMLGVDPNRLPTHRAAMEMGLVPGSVRVTGDFNEKTDFLLPEICPASFGPKPFQTFTRKHLIQRPAVKPEACRQCGECWKYCPAAAISQTSDAVTFDFDTCIRCYCCIEVCPHGAMFATQPFLGKAFGKLSSIFHRLRGNRSQWRRKRPDP